MNNIDEVVKQNLDKYKELMVKDVENRIESDFRQRMEKLETKMEKEVEDFLLKKFDSLIEKFSDDIKQKLSGAKPSESGDISVLKENVREIMDIQEELVSKIQRKGPVDAGDFGTRLNELSSSINVNGRDIKRLSSQIEEIRNRPAPVQMSSEKANMKELEEMIAALEKKLDDEMAGLDERVVKLENRKSETPTPAVRESRTSENEQKLLSRISSLESELYGMKKIRKHAGAVVLE